MSKYVRKSLKTTLLTWILNHAIRKICTGSFHHIMSWFPSAADFIICIMSLISVSLIITTGLLNLYYHSDDKPVPKWLRWLVLKWIAAVLCLKCGKSNPKVSPLKSEITNKGDIIIGSVAYNMDKEDHSSPKKPCKEILLPDYMRAYILYRLEKEGVAGVSDQNKMIGSQWLVSWTDYFSSYSLWL